MSRETERPSAARVFVLIAAAWAGLAAAQGPKSRQHPDLEWLDHDALGAGDVVVRTSKEDGAILVDTAALIRASVEDIWDVLTACEIAPEYVTNVVSCESIEMLDDGRAELFVQTIKPIFFMPRFEHVFRLDYMPHERIDVTRVSGPIDQMDGSWWLVPQPDRSVLLFHSMEVDPGFPIPRFVLRATMRKELTTIMEAVRHVAEQRTAAGLDLEP
jgi:hypothetical protein